MMNGEQTVTVRKRPLGLLIGALLLVGIAAAIGIGVYAYSAGDSAKREAMQALGRVSALAHTTAGLEAQTSKFGQATRQFLEGLRGLKNVPGKGGVRGVKSAKGGIGPIGAKAPAVCAKVSATTLVCVLR